MPPPPDPWAEPAREQPRRWPLVLGLVTAAVLTGVVATAVVLASWGPTQAGPVPDPGTSAASSTRPGSTRSVAPPGPSASASPTPSDPPSATPARTPRPVPAPTASTASTSPTAAPPAPLPSSGDQPTQQPGPDRSLRTNTVYDVDLAEASVSCDLVVRRPKPPLADDKLQAYLTEVVACLTRVFTAPLAAHGFTLVEPKVRTYHKRVESPCGDFGQDGSPAYYCSSTRTIYWPDTVDDGREAYTFARLGYVGLTAHEFGHHLQATTGMLDAYALRYTDASSTQREALSRRLELQAQCFEGVFLHATRKDLHVSTKDRAELRSWHGYTGDEDPPKDRKPDHGSSRAQYSWLERGLDSGDLSSCNTWSASSRSVT